MSYCAVCGSQLDAVGVCHSCNTLVAARHQNAQPVAALPRKPPWLVMWGCGLLVAAGVLFVILTRRPSSEISEGTSATELTSAAPVESSAATIGPPALTSPPVSAAPTSMVVVPALPTVSPTTIPSSGWNGQYVDAPGSGVLHIGHQGRRVQELQAALGNVGLLQPPYDGDFGLGTEAAVLEFQRQQGLTADGLAGTRSLAALGLGLGFTTYDDATAATLRYLNTGDGSGLARQMINDLQIYINDGAIPGASWTFVGPVLAGSDTSPATFAFVLGGDGGVYTYMELIFLTSVGHSWNGVFDVQGH